MSATDAFLIGITGSAGAVARFVVDGAVRSRTRRVLPLGTIAINVTGSFLLGIFTGLVIFAGQSELWRTAAGTGFCGGYTTFSTASFESVQLVRQRHYGAAVFNGMGTLVLTVAAGAAGLALTLL